MLRASEQSSRKTTAPRAARRDATRPVRGPSAHGAAGHGNWWRARSSDAQRGRPGEAGVDPGVPRLRLLVGVVVVVLRVVVVVPVLLAARGQRVRRRALLPPVLRPVHLDLLLPALLAAERRVTSADRGTHRHLVKKNK